jgi:predicted cupin superfamily sugar epimerase/quercetin dioxygenase-like cupin family protein
MQKIPDEGCWFSVTYVSPDRLEVGALPPRFKTARPAGTAIYALVTREDFSALHKLSTDETWHFYAGDPIELLLLNPDGHDEVVIIGPDVLAGQQPQFTVPAGVWMGARPLRDHAEAYTLFGCTLAPGFDYGDFTLGYRDDLQKKYPARAALIAELTRQSFTRKPVEPSASPPSAESASPALFVTNDIPAITISPGTELRELVGLTGAHHNAHYSLAHFTLAPGTLSGPGYLKTGEELILILSGRGTALVDGQIKPVQPGSLVVCKPGVPHGLQAAADSRLEFYAFVTPAFTPEDYVLVPAK